jgi:hypothetical protein
MLDIVIDIGRRRVVGRPRVGDRCPTSYLLEDYVEDGDVGRAGSVMWKDGTSKFVAPNCVG